MRRRISGFHRVSVGIFLGDKVRDVFVVAASRSRSLEPTSCGRSKMYDIEPKDCGANHVWKSYVERHVLFVFGNDTCRYIDVKECFSCVR